ncbi:hypothetical protein DUNSADRAFT_16559 [Dunaliella salina]|uniref:WAT1-related protein n=1 Tax=Dunaliella salina TaxID=3046 RepID=A0ABQ7H0T3_DUNSA|nr:hypothetical protein DUNSADRAFT_16559 [Dunaliella salina]|eukprot:KAF5840468.1 hypothetical protein DUNSADRAFT_16559 [Dunaliella salina]
MASLLHFFSLQAATAPPSHTIPFTKYAVGLIISATSLWSVSKRQHKSRNMLAECLALAAGLLDVAAYMMNCLGFPIVGSALSMVVFAAAGQMFTAAARTLLLKKGMSKQQCVAVAIVSVGVMVRAGPLKIARDERLPANDNMRLGVIYTTSSAALYSLLGVVYERLASLKALSHVQINLRMSLTGFVLLVLYQTFYTWPHRQRLILEPLAESGQRPGTVIFSHILFGACYTGHAMIQGRVLERSGAMAVNVVNSMRAATVSIVSALLFCAPSAQQQCLDARKGASAAIISVGALIWATAPSPQQPKQDPGKKEE